LKRHDTDRKVIKRNSSASSEISEEDSLDIDFRLSTAKKSRTNGGKKVATQDQATETDVTDNSYGSSTVVQYVHLDTGLPVEANVMFEELLNSDKRSNTHSMSGRVNETKVLVSIHERRMNGRKFMLVEEVDDPARIDRQQIYINKQNKYSNIL